MPKHIFLTPAQIDRKQEEAKNFQEPDLYTQWEMISYRCSGCLCLISPKQHFCHICEKHMKEGHSNICCRHIFYKDYQCVCTPKHIRNDYIKDIYRRILGKIKRLLGIKSYWEKYTRVVRPGLIRLDDDSYVVPWKEPVGTILSVKPKYTNKDTLDNS